ncbi:MAG: AMP-binding protein [Ilumatobacteraceae bacterium]
MATSGETVTYSEFEDRANRLAQLLRAAGLQAGDHVAMFMENHVRYFETMAAAERTGLYYTCVNSYLTARRGGVHRRRLRRQGVHHISGEARHRHPGSGEHTEGRDLPRRRRRRRVEAPSARTKPSSTVTRPSPSSTRRSVRRCSTRREPPAARRASCVPSPARTRASHCR